MDRQEARRRVSTEWVETYQYVFNQLKFVEDEHARVRAANGFMVTIDKVLPFNAPLDNHVPEPEFQTADKIAKSEPPPPKVDGQIKLDPPPKEAPGPPSDLATERQIKYLMQLAARKHISLDSIKKQMQVTKLEDIGKNAMSELIAELQGD